MRHPTLVTVRSANNVSGPSNSIFTSTSHHHIVCLPLVAIQHSPAPHHSLPPHPDHPPPATLLVNIDGRKRPVTTFGLMAALHSHRTTPHESHRLTSHNPLRALKTLQQFTTNYSNTPRTRDQRWDRARLSTHSIPGHDLNMYKKNQ